MTPDLSARDIPELAIAAFVKTPGLSPLKTRLAAGIGAERAAAFYDLAVAAVEAVLRTASSVAGMQGYWAVAETAAAEHPAWGRLPMVLQGEGGLGARIARVYRQLARPDAPRRAAVLVGADAPQITVAHFTTTRTLLAQGADFVIGPATDGGFYLFASSRDLPAALFERVPYSDPETVRRLAAELAPLGTIAWLEPQGDVDAAVDLPSLATALAALPQPLLEQQRLAAWLAAEELGGA